MQFSETQPNMGVEQSLELDVTKDVEAIMSDADAYRERLKQLPEVQNLTNEIDIQDMNTIAVFGAKPSEELSKVSDELLRSMKSVKTSEATTMLDQLTKIMDKFDIKEIEDPEKAASKSKLQKFLKKKGEQLQELFEKYDNMGKEVDKIYVLLNQYLNDIKNSNMVLARLSKANKQFYESLEKYIAAGELGVIEIDDYAASLDNSGQSPEVIAEQKETLANMKNMLQQRVYDLRVAENVAMQTAPMIRNMEKTNFNLMTSIQSAFITTLPIFKNCMISAIQMKQQAVQSRAINSMNEKTNELLLRNADNNARQSVAAAQMANQSGVKIETLQKSYETIKKGIADTKEIEQRMAQERVQNTQTLENMKTDMHNQGWA